jgi:hypothetical protein
MIGNLKYKRTKVYRLRINEIQSNTFDTLKQYNVKVPTFILDAIREKIQRDWPGIKEEKERIYIPF